LKRAGGSLDNVVTMTVFIKESRYGDKFVEMRKDLKMGTIPDPNHRDELRPTRD
jgi:hypothetical protein